MLKASADYNWWVVIIESVDARYRTTEIIRFFRYLRWTVYDVAKYNKSEMSNKSFATLIRKTPPKESICQDACRHSMDSSTDFWGSSTVNQKLVTDCWCEWKKNICWITRKSCMFSSRTVQLPTQFIHLKISCIKTCFVPKNSGLPAAQI